MTAPSATVICSCCGTPCPPTEKNFSSGSCPARKHDWAGDPRFVRASGGVRVFVDQAVEDGFSADPLDIEVGHGGPGSVASGVGDALGDALVRCFLWGSGWCRAC